LQGYFSSNKINVAIKCNNTLILLQHLFHFIAHETLAEACGGWHLSGE